jgi:hypothetical protein
MKVISNFSYSLLQCFFICDNGPSSPATVLLRQQQSFFVPNGPSSSATVLLRLQRSFFYISSSPSSSAITVLLRPQPSSSSAPVLLRLQRSFFVCYSVHLQLLFGPSSRKTKIGHVLLKKMPSSYPTLFLFLPSPPLYLLALPLSHFFSHLFLYPPSSITSFFPPLSFSLHSILRSFHTTPNQHIDTPNIQLRYNIYRTKYKTTNEDQKLFTQNAVS